MGNNKKNFQLSTFNPQFEKGFTIIELIMVMGIVSVIIGFTLVTYPSSRKRAHDTQRKSDLKQYQTALEIFANKNNGLYPSRTGAWVEAATTLCVTDLGYTASECPKDPKDNKDVCGTGTNKCRYYYRSNGSGSGTVDATNYVLYAALERPETQEYWVVCSNGNTKEVDVGLIPPAPAGTCPI